MRTKARKLERKTRTAELDMEIMRAREANGLPVISPMFGLPPEKWECGFRDYLAALGDPKLRTRPPQPGRVSRVAKLVRRQPERGRNLRQ